MHFFLFRSNIHQTCNSSLYAMLKLITYKITNHVWFAWSILMSLLPYFQVMNPVTRQRILQWCPTLSDHFFNGIVNNLG